VDQRQNKNLPWACPWHLKAFYFQRPLKRGVLPFYKLLNLNKTKVLMMEKPNENMPIIDPMHVEISGIPVSCATWNDILDAMDKFKTHEKKWGYISITNTESMYHALRIPEHMDYIQNSNFSLCDGIGSVISGLFWGHRVPRRNGPALVLKACEFGVSRGWRHFFLGGGPTVADRMVENLGNLFPGLNTVGTYCPPFRDLTSAEDKEIVDLINKSQPDIVWVGLGLLKQETWIRDHLAEINANWMIGVGAAFDYHSGEISWAPSWIQLIGMEWLYRLVLQPKYRFRRYVWSFHFMFQSILSALLFRINGKKTT
jgi:N-acetylglucosaminyldiphosphoundecaprenol N-acetyl-beta-D-mannosaminyltransferase